MARLMDRRPRDRAVIGCLCAALAVGPLAACTSNGGLDTGPGNRAQRAVVISDTQSFRETIIVRVFPRADPAAEAHAALPAGALLLAAKIAIGFIQRLVEAEARRYESVTTAATTFKMEGLSPANPPLQAMAQLNGRVDFIFMRLIDDPKGISGLPVFDRSELVEEVAAAADTAMGTDRSRLGRQEIAKTIREAVDGEGTKRAMTFCAIGRIIPRQSRESFEIQLLTYSYPALKAKSAMGGEFGRIERREDKLVIGLEGPAGFSGSGFAAGHTFPLKFEPGPSAEYRFRPLQEAVRSRPIAVPSFRDFVFTVTLAETSNFKKLLERLAKEVGELDPSRHIGN